MGSRDEADFPQPLLQDRVGGDVGVLALFGLTTRWVVDGITSFVTRESMSPESTTICPLRASTAIHSFGGGTATGRDAGIALDVRWGNQVMGSELLVFETGRYTVRERVCCPPASQSDGGTLSSAQTMGMLSDLTAARAGRLVPLDDGNAFGDTYGEAAGFDTDGARVPLREHTPVLEQANDSAAAERLRTLINTLVDVDLQ
jgi:hypothetical protein